MELNPQLPLRPTGPGAFGFGRLPGAKNEVSDRPVDLTRLHGRPDAKPNQVRVYEQPWHRNAAYMWASGKYSLKAISVACDTSYDSVKALARNPWFQETVALIQKENGADDIMAQFQSECQNSLVTLIEIRDDKQAPASVRRASAIDILHQVLGKPTQRVEMETAVTSDDPVAEAERLERQNALLRGSSPQGDKTDASPSSNPP